MAHVDVRAQDDGAPASEAVPACRASAGHARDCVEPGDPTHLTKIGQSRVDAGAGQIAVLGDLGGGHLLAVDEPVENLQGVDLPDALGTHPHPACQSVLRPWLLAPR